MRYWLVCLLCFVIVCNGYAQLTNSQMDKVFHEIKFDNKNSPLDFLFIKKYIDRKSIVQLGESGHGMKEYFELKTKLVQYLHTSLGFNLLAVEGGLAETGMADLNRQDISDTVLLRASFYSAWRFQEALPLFSYLKSAPSLKLAGFDNIPVSDYFIKSLEKRMAATEPDFYQTFFAAERSLNQFFSGRINKKSDLYQKIDSLRKAYQFINHELLNKKIAAQMGGELHHLISRIVYNRIQSIAIDTSNFSRTQMEIMRDKLMADNVQWLFESNKRTKMIIWAHNAHIAKSYGKIHHKNGPYRKWQGEYHNDVLGKKTYTIGIYCYEGAGWAYFKNDTFSIKKPIAGSLEEKLSEAGYSATFVDLKEAAKYFDWVRKPIASYEWGQFLQTITPIEQYDGLILIRKVSAPVKL